MKTFAHLVRRTFRSVRPKLSPADVILVAQTLSSAELAMWSAMQMADKAHSVMVLWRFIEIRPTATNAERSAVLLHDVGKSTSRLSTVGRIIATCIGGRTPRMHMYLAHEAIGARMLEGISDPLTIALVRGDGPEDSRDALRHADDI
ncbi:MAG: hypothetical protein ACKOFD_08485 [Actinomycetota bacterium]